MRDAPEKKAALIWVFSKPSLTPPPEILKLFGHFSLRNFFLKLLRHFLCHNLPQIREQSNQKLLDLVNLSQAQRGVSGTSSRVFRICYDL